MQHENLSSLGNLPLKNNPLTSCEAGLSAGATAPARFTERAELTAQRDTNPDPSFAPLHLRMSTNIWDL